MTVKKDPKRQLLGKIAKARGKQFESRIDDSFTAASGRKWIFCFGTRPSRYRQIRRCLPRRRNSLNRWRKRKPASSLYFDGRERNAAAAASREPNMEARGRRLFDGKVGGRFLSQPSQRSSTAQQMPSRSERSVSAWARC